MPQYKFKCQECEAEREETLSIKEGDEFLDKVRCNLPKEGASESVPNPCLGQYRRVISATSFKLEGGGWYSSGYKK